MAVSTELKNKNGFIVSSVLNLSLQSEGLMSHDGCLNVLALRKKNSSKQPCAGLGMPKCPGACLRLAQWESLVLSEANATVWLPE